MMVNQACRGFLLFFVVCFTGLAHASLNLELTQGIDAAIPIAIVPFKGNDTLSQIIQTDLQNSGHFKVMAKQEIEAFPASPDDVNFAYWKKTGVNALVVGKIDSQGDNYQVTFSILDVFHGSDPQNQVTNTKVFTVKKADIRQLAHHLSDLVYEQLTGEKGIFSTRIAYVLIEHPQGMPTKYALVVADVDGFNPKPLLISDEPIMSPSWSPDGRELAYVSFENNRAEIYRSEVASGKRELLTSYPGINGAPAWSPDGQKLAIVLSKSGYPKIYTYDLSTKLLSQITQGSSIDTEPSFAPDGNSLVFTSDRGGSPQIYQVNLSDFDIQRLTFDGSYNSSASYTSDGKNLVLLHRDGGLFNIAILDLGSGKVTNLTHSGLSESPSVAPNGKMVLYGSLYGGSGILGIVSVDGQVRLQLPSRDGDVQGPVWSPYA